MERDFKRAEANGIHDLTSPYGTGRKCLAKNPEWATETNTVKGADLYNKPG